MSLAGKTAASPELRSREMTPRGTDSAKHMWGDWLFSSVPPQWAGVCAKDCAGPTGRGDSDSPATASIVRKDTSPGTKPQVLPFVLWKTPDKFSFWKCLFSLTSSNKSLPPKYLSLPIKSPRWKTHCCGQRKASSWLVCYLSDWRKEHLWGSDSSYCSVSCGKCD